MRVELMEREIVHISVAQFADSFLGGCSKVIQHQEILNAINVFPVADKDTGNNVAKTLNGLLTERFNLSSIKAFLSQAAEYTFSSARGNSGVMFSILIDGMKRAAVDAANIKSEQFISMFESGYQQLTQEVRNIAKGTLVTIIDDFCKILRQTQSSTQTLVQHLEIAMPKLNQALEKSKNQMELLQKNKVVDAGAKAFVYFIEGFYQNLKDPKKSNEAPILKQISEQVEFEHSSTEEPAYRYCTEGMLTIDELGYEIAEQFIHEQGDSQLCQRHGDKMRFHLHCDKPWQLFNKLRGLGLISNTKVDDMLRQYQVSQQSEHRVALVTDTSADLPQALVEHHKIHLIPINININGHEVLDKFCIEPYDLYDSLEKTITYPKTSAPRLGLIREKLDYLKRYYDEVLVIPLSAQLSSTYEAVQKVAKNEPSIHLIDSRSVSAGHGLIVAYAASLIADGKACPEIIQQVNRKMDDIKAYMTVSSTKAMIRSGRINPFKGLVAKLTRLKPVVSLSHEGKGEVIATAFRFAKAVKKIIDVIVELHREKPVKMVYVVHVNNPSDAQSIAKRLERLIGVKASMVALASPSIGLHAGVGAIQVAISQ